VIDQGYRISQDSSRWRGGLKRASKANILRSLAVLPGVQAAGSRRKRLLGLKKQSRQLTLSATIAFGRFFSRPDPAQHLNAARVCCG